MRARARPLQADFCFPNFWASAVIEKHECGYQQNCSPFDQWSISFSNALDIEAFDKSQVRVDRRAWQKREVYGQNLILRGVQEGPDGLSVTLDSAIRDQFRQTLGASAPLIFNVKSAPPTLASSGDQFCRTGSGSSTAVLGL